MNITSLPATSPFASSSSANLFADASQQEASTSDTPSFSQMLQNSVGQVSALQNHAGEMAQSYAKGQTSDIHSVMIASEQATIALQMTAQIRNKAVDAYQEIMRISM